jgi:hypothetical protein
MKKLNKEAQTYPTTREAIMAAEAHRAQHGHKVAMGWGFAHLVCDTCNEKFYSAAAWDNLAEGKRYACCEVCPEPIYEGEFAIGVSTGCVTAFGGFEDNEAWLAVFHVECWDAVRAAFDKQNMELPRKL